MNQPKNNTLDEILKNSRGKKIAFVSGNFNIVHPGHLRLINFASNCAEILIVALTPDGSPDIYIDQNRRIEGIAAISKITYSFVMDRPILDVINYLKPDFVVKGKEHEFAHNVETKAVENYGGKILFSSGESFISSKDLIMSELKTNPIRNWNSDLFVDYLKRHNINTGKLKDIILKMSNINVVVIGDLIIDEYISCEPVGMSREEPVIVVTPVETKQYIGGAGIVSGHLNGLGANVSYAGVVGNDQAKDFAIDFFKANNIKHYLTIDSTRPTTLKQKIRSGGRGLLRVNYFRSHEIDLNLTEQIFNQISPEIFKADLVIFSDFNYGCLPNLLVEKISKYCLDNDIKMVADSQSSSQVGDISRFQSMMLITPTEYEARLAVRDFSAGLVGLVNILKNKSNAEHILITLGSDGLFIHNQTSNKDEICTDELPAFNKNPKDVAGAGDSLLCCASLAMAVGANIFEASYIGSIGAAIQVSRIGNTPLTQLELLEAIVS